MKVNYRPRALADLDAIVLYLEPKSPTGARNVLRAIRAAVDEIASFPDAAMRTSRPDIRVKILGRYRYKIFYRVSDEGVDVIHVRHAARRPWPGIERP